MTNLVPLPLQPDDTPWPTDAWPTAAPDPRGDGDALERHLGRAFTVPGPDDLERTHGVVVVHRGAIVAERHAHGDSDVEGTFNDGLTVQSPNTMTVTGDLSYGSLTVQNGATFTTSGAGGVAMAGTSNTTTINGAAVYNDGDTLDDAGSIDIGATGTVTFNTGATGIRFNADDDEDNVGTITNDGAITVAGGGAGAVSMANNDGAGDDNLTNQGTGTIDVQANGTLNGIDTLTNSSSSGSAIQVGVGATLGFNTLNSSAGTVTSAGTLDGDVALSGTAALVQNAGGSVDGNLSTAGASAFDINGTGGDATVEVTGTLSQGSTGSSTFAGDVAGNVAVSAGTLTVDGASEFQSGLNVTGGAVVVDADLGVTGNTLVDTGGLTVNAGNTLTSNVQSGTLGGGGSVVVDGVIDGTLDVENTATFDINAGGSVTGTATHAGTGTSTLAGTVGNLNITAAGTVQVDGAAVSNGLSFVDGGGTLAVQAGASYTASGGPLNVGFDGGNTGSGTLTVADTGSMIGNVSVFNAGTVDINGTSGDATVEVDGNLTLFAGATGTSTLAGDVSGGVTVNGGTLTTDGTSVIGTTLDIDGGTVNADAATTVTGAATVTSGSLTVGAGQSLTYASLTVADGASFTAGTGAQVFGTANTTTINGAATYNDGSALNDNGSIDIGATGSVTFNTGGTGIVFDADQDNNAVGTITSDGTITVNGTGNVSFGTDGDDNFTNQGSATLALLDSSSVSDIDVLTNSSTANGATAGTAAIFLGGGTSLGFTTLNSSAGTIVSAGTLDGDVNLSGTAGLDLNDGTITGALDNQSATAITLDGTVTGAFTQQGAGAQTTVDGTSSFGSTVDVDSGTLTVNADTTVTGATTVDDATLNVGAGSTLTASGNVLAGGSGGAGTVVVDGTLDGDVTAENTATVTVNGSVDGNLETRDTASFDINGTSGAAPAEVTGNVTQAGTSALNTLAGDIAGFLQQTGAGTITVDGDAVVSGLVNIDAGTLTVAGGATLDATGAGVDVAAGAFGNVAATGEIDGATTNAGTFQNDGTVDGVTNSGGFTNNGTTGGVADSAASTHKGATGALSTPDPLANQGSTLPGPTTTTPIHATAATHSTASPWSATYVRRNCRTLATKPGSLVVTVWNRLLVFTRTSRRTVFSDCSATVTSERCWRTPACVPPPLYRGTFRVSPMVACVPSNWVGEPPSMLVSP